MLEKLKALDRWILFYLGVPRCVGCEEPLDTPFMPLCPTCLAKYDSVKTANCSQCAKPLHKCSCVGEYLESHFIKKHFKVFRYENRDENLVANEVIYSLKQDNRADVCDFLASEIAKTIEDFVGERHDILFTNVPRRIKAVLDYGMDHAAELAIRLARYFGCEYRSLLVSKTKKAQKTTHGAEREHNVVFDYKCKRPPDLTGRTVIIVDDVVTTGASVSTAGALLRALGAKTIIAASVAATYKDKPSPLRKPQI